MSDDWISKEDWGACVLTSKEFKEEKIKDFLTSDYKKHNILGIVLDDISKIKNNIQEINNGYPTKILLMMDKTTVRLEESGPESSDSEDSKVETKPDWCKMPSIGENMEKSSIWVNIPKLNIFHLFLGIVHQPFIKSVMYRLYLDSESGNPAEESDLADCYEVEGKLWNGYWRFTQYPLLKYKNDIDVCVTSVSSRKFEVAWLNFKNFQFDKNYTSFNLNKDAIPLETFFGRSMYVN